MDEGGGSLAKEIGYYSLTVRLGRCAKHTMASAVRYLAWLAKGKCSQHSRYKGKWTKRGEREETVLHSRGSGVLC